jgi:hypothetical protein
VRFSPPPGKIFHGRRVGSPAGSPATTDRNVAWCNVRLLS